MAGEPLLRGVSFKLERRDRLTLSGRNGSGKTTLLRMLRARRGIDGGELVFAEGRAGRAARPAPAARPRPDAARLRALGLPRAARAGGASWPRSRPRWPTARPTTRPSPPTPRAQARLEHAGGYNWREARQRDAPRARLPRRAPGPQPGDVLRRRADPRLAGARARGRPGPAAARRADQPPGHRALEWLETHLQTLDAASSWSRTTAGSSRRSARRARARGGRASSSRAPGTRGAPEKAQRELALGRMIERSRPRSPSSSASWTASARARGRARRPRARSSSTRSTG